MIFRSFCTHLNHPPGIQTVTATILKESTLFFTSSVNTYFAMSHAITPLHLLCECVWKMTEQIEARQVYLAPQPKIMSVPIWPFRWEYSLRVMS